MANVVEHRKKIIQDGAGKGVRRDLPSLDAGKSC